MEPAFRAREGEQIVMKRGLLVTWEETWHGPVVGAEVGENARVLWVFREWQEWIAGGLLEEA